ncbi:MAG: hypothetical protein MZV64_62750 [Ignavibacteriales bacterium]|nr:hypothetical protein [Ignavibacteriales bacterium]
MRSGSDERCAGFGETGRGTPDGSLQSPGGPHGADGGCLRDRVFARQTAVPGDRRAGDQREHSPDLE